MMAFLKPDDSMPEPASTVQLDGHDERWPADWEIRGLAYGLCDWMITVHGGPPAGHGREVAVRLSTPLGPFEGRAILASSMVRSDGSIETTLIAAGPLAFST